MYQKKCGLYQKVDLGQRKCYIKTYEPDRTVLDIIYKK